MSVVQQLFSEKFRPKTLDQVILSQRIRDELNKGLIQNILFYSQSPGTGKCVDENTIITIRNKNTGDIIDISFKDFIHMLEVEK